MSARDDAATFARVLAALGPYLGELTFIGGWAHRLYPLHELARPPDFVPLTTADLDVATPLDLHVRDKSIAQRLADEGFVEELSGEHVPPVSQYRLGHEEGGLYVEFLAPVRGGTVRRDGSPDATVKLAGITAQKLHHLDVVLEEPWMVRLSEASGYPVGSEGQQVRIVNPVSYFLQKLLVLPKRRRDQQEKDILYLQDTLAIFAPSPAELRACAQRVCPKLHRNDLREFQARRAELFGKVGDLARGAARIAAATGRASPPSAEVMTAACRLGLARIFDEPLGE